MVTKYAIYTCDGTETITAICKKCTVSIPDVIRINDFQTTKQLSRSQMMNIPLPKGFFFKLPVINTGSNEDNTDSYDTDEIVTPGYELGSQSNLMKRPDFNCTVYVLLNGKAGPVVPLMVYPQEFSDNNSAIFSSQSILGRSVDYQIYQGSSRNVAFTLNLHDEISTDRGELPRLVSYIQSACYPGYSSGIVQVPEVCFTIGKQFKVRGILETCGVVWKPPIIDGKMTNCDLSISVKETSGPYSSHQVRSMGGMR